MIVDESLCLSASDMRASRSPHSSLFKAINLPSNSLTSSIARRRPCDSLKISDCCCAEWRLEKCLGSAVNVRSLDIHSQVPTEFPVSQSNGENERHLDARSLESESDKLVKLEPQTQVNSLECGIDEMAMVISY